MLRLVPEMMLDFQAARARVQAEREMQARDDALGEEEGDDEVDDRDGAVFNGGGGGEAWGGGSWRMQFRPRDRNYDIIDKKLVDFEEFVRLSCADLLARPSNTLQVKGFCDALRLVDNDDA